MSYSKRNNHNTAGAKAPADIETLMQIRGAKAIHIIKYDKHGTKIQKIFGSLINFANWLKIYLTLRENSILLIQHPYYKGIRFPVYFIKKAQSEKRVKVIVLIHDLESIRGGITDIVKIQKDEADRKEKLILSCANSIICHNACMKKYLISCGYNSNIIIELKIFDYLYNGNLSNQSVCKELSIAIAGNLATGKSKYISLLPTLDHKLKIHLFGPNYVGETQISNIIYHGQFKPDELPQFLVGAFGLVWDGDNLNSCSGNTGDYLRLNNPHKVSLYLLSEIPVIIWKESAMASFIENNNLGLTVKSVYDIPQAIQNLTDEQYSIMQKNVVTQSLLLRKGHYFLTAMDKAISNMG